MTETGLTRWIPRSAREFCLFAGSTIVVLGLAHWLRHSPYIATPEIYRLLQFTNGLLAFTFAAIAILWLSRAYTFYFDEWDFIQSAPGWGWASYLEPHIKAYKERVRHANPVGKVVNDQWLSSTMGLCDADDKAARELAAKSLRTFFGPDVTIKVILFTLVGGIGTVWGPVVGAGLLYPTGEWLRGAFGGQLPGLDILFYGSLVVLCCLLFPAGVIGSLSRLVMNPEAPRQEAAESTR